ncbi:hypothetical protein EDC19_1692 [Natranaerovirga hydrolytica]|uniref:Uncharacterized protein n=1 Tax=Natranaerovirga hydrolytica TaxID=680378 RepID=A0A4R1MIK5_9FIRM|nr:hypothetical protein [Natranaerovirga hydrolytica]TCK92548.1 hypothetical protein EDC19_1692 [Natranaerovirga hydrolytica]
MMGEKNTRAKHIIIIIIVSMLLLCVVGVYKYFEKEKKADSDYLLPNGLSFSETMYYLKFYHLFSHPNINLGSSEVIRKDYNIKKDGVDIYPTIRTEMFLPVLNYFIFEEDRFYYDISEENRKRFGEYGFNNENYMTVQWVLENPIEASKDQYNRRKKETKKQ